MLPKHITCTCMGFTVATVLVICICYIHVDDLSRMLTVPTSKELPPPIDKLKSTSNSVAASASHMGTGDSQDTYKDLHSTVAPVRSNIYVPTGELKGHGKITPVGEKIKVDVHKSLTEAERPSVLEKPLANKFCQPLTHIVFFKMHKCSSSTVQNILFRYGEEHRLNFVLPPQGNYLGRALFHRRFMIDFPVKEYNVFCHHTIFNAKAVAEVMPSSSVYITILRDPVPMFESVFSYNTMANIYNLPESRGVELFFKKPEYYYSKNDGGIIHLRNPMLHGLGLPKTLLGDEVAINKKMEEAQKQFDLVMMTEYFEESLILLKELMCWEMDDVVYFVVNARSKSVVRPLSPQLASQIRRWNRGDVKLYNAFNRTFWQKVETFGLDRMKQEVAQLQERNRYYKQRCISKVTNINAKVLHPPGVPVDSFMVKPEAMGDTMCARMTEPELPYTKHLRDIQKKRYRMA